MGYWLVEANARSGALWGFLVEGHGLSRPQVVAPAWSDGRANRVQNADVSAKLASWPNGFW
jgi:hypothetical protein